MLLLQLMLAAAAADDDAGVASPCTFPRICANGTVGEQMMSIRKKSNTVLRKKFCWFCWLLPVMVVMLASACDAGCW